MGRRRIFTKEFKESAMELYHSSGKSAKDIAEQLGFDSTNLTRWLRESKAAEGSNRKIFPGQGNPRDEEVALLKRKLADLEETNEILKKAVAIFAIRKTL